MASMKTELIKGYEVETCTAVPSLDGGRSAQYERTEVIRMNPFNMEKKPHEQIADELCVKITNLIFCQQPDAMLSMHRELVRSWINQNGIVARLKDAVKDEAP